MSEKKYKAKFYKRYGNDLSSLIIGFAKELVNEGDAASLRGLCLDLDELYGSVNDMVYAAKIQHATLKKRGSYGS